MGLNRYECMGRVGSLKLAYLPDGRAVMEMSVAVDESYKNRDGQKVEKCEWVSVKAFEKQAEFIDKWCRVGKRVYVQGKLATRSWEKDGQKHYKTEIHVNAPGFGVEPIDWPERDEQPTGQPQQRQGGQDQAGFPTDASGMSDVPF